MAFIPNCSFFPRGAISLRRPQWDSSSLSRVLLPKWNLHRFLAGKSLKQGWVGSDFIHLTRSLSLLLFQVCDGSPDCELADETEPSLDEQGCGAWGSWGPWEPCSQTCGPGIQSRNRNCSISSLHVLQNCPGLQHQSQACFTEACPGEGRDI